MKKILIYFSNIEHHIIGQLTRYKNKIQMESILHPSQQLVSTFRVRKVGYVRSHWLETIFFFKRNKEQGGSLTDLVLLRGRGKLFFNISRVTSDTS